jgi:hypothetical protein
MLLFPSRSLSVSSFTHSRSLFCSSSPHSLQLSANMTVLALAPAHLKPRLIRVKKEKEEEKKKTATTSVDDQYLKEFTVCSLLPVFAMYSFSSFILPPSFLSLFSPSLWSDQELHQEVH